jgi:ADP-ribose pyrophosphatase YjhB (NUDIX family)
MLDGPRTIIVRGICVHDGKILLIHVPKTENTPEHFILPGGRADEDESIEVALKREFEKDTGGVNVAMDDLFYSKEKHFGREGEEYDCYIVNYQVGMPTQTKENTPTTPVWVPLEHLKNINLYPETIKELILKDIS